MAAPISTPPSYSSRGAISKLRGLLAPLQTPNAVTPPDHPPAALCTPVDVEEHHTPPSELRRDSLDVPSTGRMIRLAQGSGVSVYRMDRSPRNGRPRSPWVLKKANVSPLHVGCHLLPPLVLPACASTLKLSTFRGSRMNVGSVTLACCAQVRERRRVERTLEHESCMLASMNHPNIVGFRAAQRLADGHICLALEHCEISLYQMIQELSLIHI